MSEKLVRLEDWFRNARRVVVAYSGGVDSTLVAYMAHKVLKGDTLAVTFRTKLMGKGEVEEAAKLAKDIGLNHLVMDTSLPERVMENPRDRCYICKKYLMRKLREFAKDSGYDVVVDGTNYDDLSEHRPGTKALKEEGVRSPLVELGIGKKAGRELSRMLGLDYQKASSPCLATRFPYGHSIKFEELNMVASGEDLLKKEGFKVVRIRHLGETAKIEVEEGEIQRIIRDEVRRRINEGLKALGYKVVVLDLEGYRSGKMDSL